MSGNVTKNVQSSTPCNESDGLHKQTYKYKLKMKKTFTLSSKVEFGRHFTNS